MVPKYLQEKGASVAVKTRYIIVIVTQRAL